VPAYVALINRTEEGIRNVRDTVERARWRRQLTKKIPIRPDLILHGGGQDLAAADVKYKELKPAEWPHADLYQMLAYCVYGRAEFLRTAGLQPIGLAEVVGLRGVLGLIALAGLSVFVLSLKLKENEEELIPS
jgi:hypothetical protein